MRRLSRLFLLAAVSLAAGCAPTLDRITIRSASELPARDIQLDRLPTALFDAPRPDLQPLVKTLLQRLDEEQRRYAIHDVATLAQRHRQRAVLLALRGQEPEMRAALVAAREMQTKEASRYTLGMLMEVLVPAAIRDEGPAAVEERLLARIGQLPRPLVDEDLRQLQGQLQLMQPALVRGSLAAQLDGPAQAAGLRVPEQVALQVLEVRLQMDLLARYGAAVQGTLATVLANAAEAPDLWSARTYELPASAVRAPVRIGIWDSGVDLKLLRPSQPAGLSFDADGRRSHALLRPLPPDIAEGSDLRAMVKGVMDLRVGHSSAEATTLRQQLAALSPADAPAFQRRLQEGALHLHGTHVAGIAVDGNPGAEVFAATQLWPTMDALPRPSRARAEATASVYREMVLALKAAGVRVVTMSWRYGPSAYEALLARHAPELSPAERRSEALAVFAIERDALREALQGAPEILFVAGAGNEGNDAGFDEYLPAGLRLPNVLTVGAVDRALRETSFSSTGSAVHVYANGHEVESVVPGGARLKLSGTSMAAPQVANAAAKLLAEWPELDTATLRQLLLDSATPGEGSAAALRVLNPRRAREAAASLVAR